MFHRSNGKKLNSFSKGKAYPKFQKVLTDPSIHLKHQIWPCCECGEYFSKIKPSYFPFHLHRSIFQILLMEEEFAQTDQKQQLESQVLLQFLPHHDSLPHCHACTSAFPRLLDPVGHRWFSVYPYLFLY